MILSYKFLDAVLSVVAFSIAYLVNYFLMPSTFLKLSEKEFLILLPVVVSSAWIVFEWMSILSQYSRPLYGLQAAADDMKVTSLIMILLILIVWVFDISSFGQLLALLFFVINVALRISVRSAIRKTTKVPADSNTGKVHNLLIVGSKDRAQEIIQLVRERYLKDYRILGCLEVDKALVGKELASGVKVIGSVSDFEKILKQEVVDEVIFAMPLNKIINAHGYIVLAEDMGALVRIIPDWQIFSIPYKPRIASLIFEPFMGLPTMALVTTLRGRFALMAKELLDYLTALSVIIMLFPLFIGIAVAIKIKSPGPVFFKQERIGLRGRRFFMYKFRTMISNAESLRNELQSFNEADGPVFKIKDDPRIIPGIGRFLRRTGLDELPQFFNILSGQMSVVGPRPPIEGEVARYEVPQLRRLSVKPGITCLWQCMPCRNKVSFQTWVDKDLEYIDNWSLLLDVKIVLRTVVVVLSGHGR